jgi:hypothetical protein
MANMTNQTWDNLTSELKDKIINSIDQTIHFFGSKRYSSGMYKKFGDKPRIMKLSNGRFILTNTCRSWSQRFDFECAIHWCNLENFKNGHFVIWMD